MLLIQHDQTFPKPGAKSYAESFKIWFYFKYIEN